MSGQGSEYDANIGIPMPPFLHKYVKKNLHKTLFSSVASSNSLLVLADTRPQDMYTRLEDMYTRPQDMYTRPEDMYPCPQDMNACPRSM